MIDGILQLVSNGFTLTISLATLFACLFAIVWGQWPEKVAGVGILAGWGLSLLVFDRDGHAQPALAAVDAVVLLGLGWATIATKRAWLLWATAAQLLMVVSHGAMVIFADVSLAAFSSVLGVWSLVLVTSLIVGALQHPARAEGWSWT